MDFRLYLLTSFVWFPGQLHLTGVSSMTCNFQNLQHYSVTIKEIDTFNVVVKQNY